MEISNLFGAINLLGSKKQFGDLTVKVEHDILGEVEDFVTIRRISDPHTVYFSNVRGFFSRTLQGKRLSGGTFTLVDETEKTLKVDEEIVAWVHQASQQMQEVSGRFTSVAQ